MREHSSSLLPGAGNFSFKCPCPETLRHSAANFWWGQQCQVVRQNRSWYLLSSGPNCRGLLGRLFPGSESAELYNMIGASCRHEGPILFDDPSKTQFNKMLFAYQYRDLTRHRFAQGGMPRCAAGERTIRRSQSANTAKGPNSLRRHYLGAYQCSLMLLSYSGQFLLFDPSVDSTNISGLGVLPCGFLNSSQEDASPSKADCLVWDTAVKADLSPDLLRCSIQSSGTSSHQPIPATDLSNS